MRCINSYGVSEVIGLVMIVMIAVSSISVIVFWGVPYMDSKKVSVRVDSALTQFKTINDVIQRVSSEGINKSERVDFVTDAGNVNINDGDRFVFYYSTNNGFSFNVDNLGDTDDREFNIFGINGGDWSGTGTLFIYYLYTNPPVTESWLVNPVVNNIITAGIGNEFKNAVKMEFINNNIVYGRIWLFDTGSISYDLPTSSGTYSVVAENEGVVRASSGSGYLYYTPKIYHKDNLFTLRITRLQPSGPTGGSGMNRYEFLIKSDNSSVQENKIHIPINAEFKIRIYGDERITDAWADYFTSKHSFNKDENDVLTLDGELYFTLVYSVCDVLMMV